MGNIMTNNVETINVGGARFQTAKSTLTKMDGLFKTMLMTGKPPLTKDDSGAIFIDRDPTHFHRILNYMRDGELNLPESVEDVQDLQIEAKYYCLNGLVKLCDAELDRKYEAFLNDEGIPVKCGDVEKALLTFYYSLNTAGNAVFPVGFNIRKFVERYQHKVDIKYENINVLQVKGLKEDPSAWLFRISSQSKKWQEDTIYTNKYGIALWNNLEIQIESFFRTRCY